MRPWIQITALLLGSSLLPPSAGKVTADVSESSPGPQLSIVRHGTQVVLTFLGTLEVSEAVTGPWTSLTNVASPLVVEIGSDQKVYRAVSAPPGVDGIFDSRSVVEWRITGPLQQHFDLAFAGTPDGIFPPKREKPYFEGTLQMGSLTLPVDLRVRGNSSLQECPFPKMKFKVSREDREGTPFAEAREIDVGTHCAEGGRGNVGRLRDERATFREVLAYETMELLGFVGPRARRARIEYRDTSPADQPESLAEGRGWQITRNALIAEDVEVVAERLGGRALADTEIGELRDAFDAQLLTDLELLHALLGNWDYALSMDGRELWNTEVIELNDGKRAPVAGDFDLASWVTGEVRLSAPHDYRPDLAEVERQVLYKLEEIQQQVGAAAFKATSDRFKSVRAVMEAQIAAAEIDEEGRTNALRHVTAFFDALVEVESKIR